MADPCAFCQPLIPVRCEGWWKHCPRCGRAFTVEECRIVEHEYELALGGACTCKGPDA